MNKLIAAALVLCPLVSAQAATTTYTDEATFLTHIAPGYYLETFSTYTYGDPLNGTTTTADFSSGGFAYTASAANGLWSNTAALTTTYPIDALIITFTGNPVTAIGGFASGTDIAGGLIDGSIITVRTNDGTEIPVTTSLTGGGFAGFVSDTPITSVTFRANDPLDGTWPQLQSFYVGTVPEPGLLAILAGASLMLMPRKRQRAAAER